MTTREEAIRRAGQALAIEVARINSEAVADDLDIPQAA